MTTVRLEAKPDHILRLAGLRDPLRGVAEMIWNSVDAEATTVDVGIALNAAGGVGEVTVSDDGHGMNRQECIPYFTRLGGSWKSSALVSPKIKRPLHGKSGQGRLRAFALGHDVVWTTVGEKVTGGHEETVVTGHVSKPDEFDVSPSIDTDKQTGTVFAATEPADFVNRLSKPEVTAQLTAVFAAYLLSNPMVKIRLQDHVLDPADIWLHSEEYVLEIEQQSPAGDAPTLRVIEWKDEVPRTISLCDEQGVELAQHSPNIRVPGHYFTAYIRWSGFKSHHDALMLADFEDGPVNEVLESARETLREHFRNRELIRQRQQIAEWKEQDLYPYGEPSSPAETVERGLFDEVATTIARQLPASKDGKRTTLRLLKELIARDPDDVADVVEQVFSLPKSEQDDIKQLLKRTTLSAIVKATAAVTARLDFLAALRILVFDPTARKNVKERKELHRILQRQPWVFGDEYDPMVSDQSLDTVLVRHLKALGRTVDYANLQPVRRDDGRKGIVDLLLGRARRGSSGREHLVVELKAPRVNVGDKEVNQIKSYAQAVVGDPQFHEPSVRWNFWVISTELSGSAKKDAASPNSPPGCIATWDNNVSIWARTWSEIIDDCESRLQYYRNCLDYDATQTHALEHLQRFHGDVMPPILRTGRDSGSAMS